MVRRLVCIIPQIRNGDRTWDGFKTHVLDVLNADLLLCIGDSRPRSGGRLIPDVDDPKRCGYHEHAKYTFERPDPVDDWSEAFDEMSVSWREVSKYPGGWLGPAKRPHAHADAGGIVLFFRWYLLQILEKHGLLATYDQIIVTRSDYYWVKDHPILDVDHTWFPNGEFHGGVCDRHMVVSSNRAPQYLGIGGTISPAHDIYMNRFLMSRLSLGLREFNIETYLYFRYVLAGLASDIAFFQQKMFIASLPSNAGGDTYDSKYDVFVRYKAEYDDAHDDTRDDAPPVVWPWKIDHTFVRNDMLTGRLIAVSSTVAVT